VAALVSDFVNLWETEADREQPVLLAHRPGAGKVEALAQPHPIAKPPKYRPYRIFHMAAVDQAQYWVPKAEPHENQ
jgi:hypothetical protein